MKERLRGFVPLLSPSLVPAVVLAAFWSGGRSWAFGAVIWIYLAALLADMVAGEDETGAAAAPFAARLMTWLAVPLQAAVIVTGLVAVTSASDPGTLYIAAVGAGAVGGMFGIPVAHELMHRPGRFERLLAAMQMAMFSYAHFCIEHVEGHHRNAGLRRDPATARFGETLYEFLPRTVCGGFADAWRLERQRLSETGARTFSAQNRMLRYLFIQTWMYAAIGLAFGWRGVVFFAGQGFVAVLLIEVLNYVEHYGLSRAENEPVTDLHSWNSSHRVSNWLMFNVPRHSDHHADAATPYPLLRHAGGERQLPAGYFAMFVLALFPPLWRRIMDPLVEMEAR